MTGRIVLLLLAAAAHLSAAHEHHGENIPEGAVVSPDPLDSILWWHICTMIVAFGILFPIGMVLGIVRSKWHVPVQVHLSSSLLRFQPGLTRAHPTLSIRSWLLC
jgi:hypothetical protein